MSAIKRFERHLLRNYLIGSFVAVFGVGCLFIFETLTFTGTEQLILIGIMFFSVSLMVLLEYLVYSRHVRALRYFFQTDFPSLSSFQNAYRTAHRFPVLTVQRIMGPHFLGLSVPSSLLTALAISQGWLRMPYYLIGLACFGAVLVAILHALIEFFLTYRVTEQMLLTLEKHALDRRFDVPKKTTVVTLRHKMLISTLIIGVFPVMLFVLASAVQLTENESLRSYWSWATLILVVILSVATFCSLLLYENIRKPIAILQQGIQDVENNRLISLPNPYSDEFSHLVSGFNLMMEGIKKRDEQNEQLLDSLFTLFAATLDARDPYTAGHSLRVAAYSVEIATAANLPHEQIELLRKSALLHDIGKIGIRDDVLLKEGRLTDEEFQIIQQHPVIGVHILSQVQLPKTLQPILPGVKYHHERYDGKGYPEGLVGEDIPLFGRIMAIADAYDAMTSDRPYRKGMPVEKALSILEEGMGTQWDATFTRLFLDLKRSLIKDVS
ncbi:HD-GYP domain-containing protein [Exiguobacterium sp. OS-77]|uniref:HD-GYP domain-containing protein n=1 Tax=Exiguobacterium sp. OS-77 TaxID=1241306 RepID=UPI0003F941D2|nr:HD domain-containing phosphohydrolase [Exiguobacterium sp. OS-77]